MLLILALATFLIAYPDRGSPIFLVFDLFVIALLLIFIASQLFWLRRLIELGERFIPGKRGRLALKVVVIGVCLLFFGGVMLPWHSTSGNGTYASTTVSLRNILFSRLSPGGLWGR